MNAIEPRPARADEGFTLVEMIVATALFALVFTVLGGAMIATITTQGTVTTVTSSTRDAQVVATTIDTRIRNSSEFQVTNVGADQLLVARVAGSGSSLTWRCYGWYFSSANGGSIRMTSTAPGTKITTPSADQLASWTLLVSGVAPRTGSTVFTASGTQLAVAFDATAGDNQPVAIDFTTVRLTGVSEALTCY